MQKIKNKSRAYRYVLNAPKFAPLEVLKREIGSLAVGNRQALKMFMYTKINSRKWA